MLVYLVFAIDRTYFLIKLARGSPPFKGLEAVPENFHAFCQVPQALISHAFGLFPVFEILGRVENRLGRSTLLPQVAHVPQVVDVVVVQLVEHLLSVVIAICCPLTRRHSGYVAISFVILNNFFRVDFSAELGVCSIRGNLRKA